MFSSVAPTAPVSAPWLISALISSSVRFGSASPLMPKTRSTTLVEAVSTPTTGPPMRDSIIIGRATHDAIASGLLRPMRFGTSSPMISDSTVITATTSAERDAFGVRRELRDPRDRLGELSPQSSRRRRRRPARRPG